MVKNPVSPSQLTSPRGENNLPAYQTGEGSEGSEPGNKILPQYEVGGFHTPTVTYHMRQENKKRMALVQFSPTWSVSYEVETKSSMSFFSKRPDISLIRVQHDGSRSGIASVMFHHQSEWPGATLRMVTSPTDSRSTSGITSPLYQIQSKLHYTWVIIRDGIAYSWNLHESPYAFILKRDAYDFTIARFTYTVQGTKASHGAEVGALDVFKGDLADESGGVDFIVSSCVAVTGYYKRMGASFQNEEVVLKNHEESGEAESRAVGAPANGLWDLRNRAGND